MNKLAMPPGSRQGHFSTFAKAVQSGATKSFGRGDAELERLPAHLICVRFRNLRWEVSLDGRTRPLIDWLCTRERAIEHALELGRELVAKPGREVVRVVVEGPGGFEHALT